MNRARRSWWLIYALCVVGTLAVLVWVTALVLRLERAEQQARARATHQEAMRHALWRMDSWFSPHLARESARPYFEYRPFYAQEQTYTKLLSRIEPGEVLIPSPLLTQRFDYIRLHFQVDADGAWTSPKVPTGNQRDLVEAHAVSIEEFERSRAALAQLAESVPLERIRRAVESAEDELAGLLAPADAAARAVLEPQAQQRGALQQQVDLNTRAQWTLQSKNAYEAPGKSWEQPTDLPERDPVENTVEIGPLVAVWLGDASGSEPELCFIRRVRVASGEVFQGFACDWPRLRATLVGQAAEGLPDATLVPALAEATVDPKAQRLATIPAVLEAPCAPIALAAGGLASPLTPARGTLLVTWFAALLAVTAVGVTLRASIDYGEKRSRFASAVTHELRTPLTTFRMYSEMLAKGMVRDEDKRRAYLETLQQESDRLARLVENVLAYARLEDGRRELRRERVTGEALFERVLPDLRPRCEQAGLELDTDLDGARQSQLRTDVEAVGQILFNLVDNACKYGRSSTDARLHLEASLGAAQLAIRVRDHGPGVPDARRAAIFGAFDRGDRDPSDAEPGVGLGLALARGLARDLGGDLVLEPRGEHGACFRLELPVVG